ncbi:MAG: hypothetical protein JW818_06590 [Pirellulales bacterium]|nr:hypothetical protein [Pirellulales bacterium]
MMIRLLSGLAWFVGFYFAACFVLGAVAGGIAGANNPEAAAQAGAEAGARIVIENRVYIILGSAVVALAGTLTGILPGTKKKVRKGDEISYDS